MIKDKFLQAFRLGVRDLKLWIVLVFVGSTIVFMSAYLGPVVARLVIVFPDISISENRIFFDNVLRLEQPDRTVNQGITPIDFVPSQRVGDSVSDVAQVRLDVIANRIEKAYPSERDKFRTDSVVNGKHWHLRVINDFGKPETRVGNTLLLTLRVQEEPMDFIRSLISLQFRRIDSEPMFVSDLKRFLSEILVAVVKDEVMENRWRRVNSKVFGDFISRISVFEAVYGLNLPEGCIPRAQLAASRKTLNDFYFSQQCLSLLYAELGKVDHKELAESTVAIGVLNEVISLVLDERQSREAILSLLEKTEIRVIKDRASDVFAKLIMTWIGAFLIVVIYSSRQRWG